MAAGCDLQPRIVSLPDSVGDFISTRYPALLADPETEAEIYNSAATDYGVYASPELYGSVESDDYLLYASVDDYVLGPQDVADANNAPVAAGENDGAAPAVSAPDDGPAPVADTPGDQTPAMDEYLMVPMYGGTPDAAAAAPAPDTITVARGDTLYSLAKKYGTTVDELAARNHLAAPYALRVGQKLTLGPAVADAPASVASAHTPAPSVKTETPADQITVPARRTATTTMVELQDVIVGPGDTLYSLSRRYATPVNDLAVMNKLSAPFTLAVGQKLRVPKLAGVPVHPVVTPVKSDPAPGTKDGKSAPAAPAKDSKTPVTKPAVAPAKSDAKPSKPAVPAASAAPAKPAAAPAKISSNPAKKLPALSARSSSKFAWPVRGTILSQFGAKSGGLFNDGINIAAARGTAVRAAENGVVAYAGNEVKGMGNLVIVQHSGGWMTVYAHMDSMGVRRGTRVNVGQKIGAVGQTGKVTKPQLHFEIRKGTKAYNPTSYLK